MSAAESIKGIRRALSRLEHVEALHRSAFRELRAWCREARAEGLSIDRIARETELSREEVRDLLTAGNEG